MMSRTEGDAVEILNQVLWAWLPNLLCGSPAAISTPCWLLSKLTKPRWTVRRFVRNATQTCNNVQEQLGI